MFSSTRCAQDLRRLGQIKGTKLENQSIAQIVIPTASNESQTLAFNYASLVLTTASSSTTSLPTASAQDHESALTDKPLNPERTQTLGAVIASQLGSLTDLKTYVAAAVQGKQRRRTPRALAVPPNGVELGDIYEPAMPVSPNQFPFVIVIAVGVRPRVNTSTCAVDRRMRVRISPCERVVRPAAPCSGRGSSNGPGSAGMYARPKRPPDSTRSCA
ncbi:hypothetical protein V8E53_002210 [Lactarius tabidus]